VRHSINCTHQAGGDGKTSRILKRFYATSWAVSSVVKCITTPDNYWLRNKPAERSSQLLCGGSLKSRKQQGG